MSCFGDKFKAWKKGNSNSKVGRATKKVVSEDCKQLVTAALGEVMGAAAAAEFAATDLHTFGMAAANEVICHAPNLAASVTLATQGSREMALAPLTALLPWVVGTTDESVDWLAKARGVFTHLKPEQLQLLLTSGVLYYVRAAPKELVYIPAGWFTVERVDRRIDSLGWKQALPLRGLGLDNAGSEEGQRGHRGEEAAAGEAEAAAGPPQARPPPRPPRQ